MYVDEYGDSVGPFKDRNDIKLYPQFEPITYRIIYNYGSQQIPNAADFANDGFIVEQATFDEVWNVNANNNKVFPSKNVFHLVGQRFLGWFTSLEKGEQISDENGNVLGNHRYVDETIALVATSSNIVCLYAHFASTF